MTGGILVDQKDCIATVTINRPEKLNAVTYEMLRQFEKMVSSLVNDPSVFIVIFTGAGNKAFSAGFDLETVKGLKKTEYREFFKLLEKVVSIIRNSRNVITIAAINGYAVGFGAIIASACDFRFFSDNAAFKLPEIDISIFPGMGAISGLMRILPISKVKDIILTGRTVPAGEAKDIGIADRIFNQADLMKETMDFAEELAKKDRRIVLRSKNLIDSIAGREFSEAIDVEMVFTDEWLREVEEP